MNKPVISMPERLVGEAILGVITVIGTGYEFWNGHRLLSLLVVVGGFIAIILIHIRVAFVYKLGLAIPAGVVVLLIYFIYPEQSTTAATALTNTHTGIASSPLRPGGEPTPPNACSDQPGGQDIPFVAILGRRTARIISGVGKFAVIKVASCSVLLIERNANGDISVDAELFDESGKLKASVRDNVATVVTGADIRADRGDDLSTLRVTDSAGTELLYVHYVNPSAIIVHGLFGCGGHPPVYVGAEGIFAGPAGFVDGFCAAGVDIRF